MAHITPNMNTFKTIIISLLAGLTGSALFAFLNYGPKEKAVSPIPLPVAMVSKTGVLPSVNNQTERTSLRPSFEYAASKSVDAVVHVRTSKRTRVHINHWHEMLGYQAPDQMEEASGSGVIISQDGFIVTNYHVVEAADEIMVSLNSNRNYEAEVVGTDPSTDLAVLRIHSSDPLPSIEFADSDGVNVGEWVLAVGNPFDLTSTVTAGIVSAKARNINLLRARPERGIFPIESFIQTDAAVNPGNSGGALVNTQGKLIGINTAIASRTGSYAGYAFAVPSTIVQKVASDLMTFGEVKRAYIGIQIEPVTERIAEKLQMEKVEGCAITAIVPGSGAANSGIEIDDVVLAIDGMQISNFPELQECISQYHPGDQVLVRVWREAEILEVTIQLKDRNGQLAQKPVELSQKNDILTNS